MCSVMAQEAYRMEGIGMHEPFSLAVYVHQELTAANTASIN